MSTFNRREFVGLAAQSALTVLAAHTPVQGQDSAPAGKPRIKIGQIGTAHAHASGKLETIRSSPDFECVGVVEPDPARRANAGKAKAYAGVTWMTEEQLLNSPGLQAVAVETSVSDLVVTAKKCVAAGKHVHLDKPAGESLPAFRELLEEAKRQKVIVQMGYMLRYNPAFQQCFRMVREGWFGEIFSIDTTMSKLLGAAERKGLLPYRGGSMFELGCHVIDAAVFILGRPQKVTSFQRTLEPYGDQYLDSGLAVLEYPTATVTVRSAMVEVEGGARRQFVVCGTGGTFDIRPLEPAAARLALSAAREGYRAGYQDVKFPKTGGRYDGDFTDLARVIRGEKSFEFSYDHDLAVQETVLLASGMPIQ